MRLEGDVVVQQRVADQIGHRVVDVPHGIDNKLEIQSLAGSYCAGCCYQVLVAGD